ncbi:MAG: sodium:proton antiporter [Gemmatimonadetes bacterium]|uniref:Sodium:proton antiporter n=1 Tax=Candidatus Kutchimonas denitrificans TaxID=3056748 RepID=A0AAE4ZC55_9BACT|nr:sodium:proton antiporter [Gemmatimonadota bacterium]NIR74830.1 sodium:proton antiporter [Candidatus Kutchimonas denitrificans]NIR99941.1 sodium:proton antiporter [Gemmatimonadota bacterium]NIT65525.1 sodium:proton antiporter [Gemmatimonadota bacterium]NIU52495.1 sodium:proton antiporter [Gemmatimonadota bacterium]
MPPAVAIILAFLTREVISSLFIGIALGGVISGDLNIVTGFLIPSIGSESYALILLVYLWSLGGLIGLWTRTGGAQTFALWAGRLIVVGPRSAKFFAWLMGIIFHQGGTISTVLTGTTVRPICDRHRISHEETSYIVDSTASPAATLIPFNVWPIYVGGLVVGTVPFLGTTSEAIGYFFKALPFNFYAWFAIIFTLLFSLELLPFMPGRLWGHVPLVVGRKMSNAIRRARATGELDREDASPLTSKELTEVRVAPDYNAGLIDFFGPMGTLLGVAIIPYLYTFFVLRSDQPTLLIAEAFVLAVLAGMAIALWKGMSLEATIGAFVDGCKGVTIGAIVLALAVTLKSVADAVGTAAYIVEVSSGFLTPVIVPAAFLLLCMLIAFSTGTSWGTYAVVFPVAMPLAYSVSQDPFFLLLCFGAVTGGSVFGDQCSPISDTTILSSLATGADLMDHVYTQIPLALTAAGLGAVVYTLLAAFAV